MSLADTLAARSLILQGLNELSDPARSSPLEHEQRDDASLLRYHLVLVDKLLTTQYQNFIAELVVPAIQAVLPRDSS